MKCKECCEGQEPDYEKEFYKDKNHKLHYIVVCKLFNNKLIDASKRRAFFGEKYNIYSKLNIEDLIFSLNDIYDYTKEPIVDIIKKYTNIPIDVIMKLDVGWDSFGCKHDNVYTREHIANPSMLLNDTESIIMDNYFNNTSITFEDKYMNIRIKEINKRKIMHQEGYKPQALKYPWGKSDSIMLKYEENPFADADSCKELHHHKQSKLIIDDLKNLTVNLLKDPLPMLGNLNFYNNTRLEIQNMLASTICSVLEDKGYASMQYYLDNNTDVIKALEDTVNSTFNAIEKESYNQ